MKLLSLALFLLTFSVSSFSQSIELEIVSTPKGPQVLIPDIGPDLDAAAEDKIYEFWRCVVWGGNGKEPQTFTVMLPWGSDNPEGNYTAVPGNIGGQPVVVGCYRRMSLFKKVRYY